MEDNSNFETIIFISSEKLIISVDTELNKNIYRSETLFKRNFNNLPYAQLDEFLNKNIFNIENKLNNFVNKIYLIIDFEEFFTVNLSIKKNLENKVNSKVLNHLLYDAKDCCKETLENKKIIHMIINNYKIDNEEYFELPKNIDAEKFTLELSFITLDNDKIKNLEDIFKKYHISIKQIVYANYVKKFLVNKNEDIFVMSKKIINGYNQNEVELIKKNTKNQGFFEKFFNFFN